MNPLVAERRRRAAERRRARRMKLMLRLRQIILLLVLVLLVEIAVYEFTSPRLWVHRIDVTGLDTLTEVEILRLAAVPARTNTWLAPKRKTAARVSAGDPRIAGATVRRVRGGVLAIAVQERQPVCRLGASEPPAYLDQTGHLFTRPAPPRAPVPVVDGVPALGESPAWGRVLEAAEATLALKVTAALAQVGGEMAAQVRRVVLAPGADAATGRVKLVLEGGTPVFIGAPVDIDLKVSVARFTLAAAREQGHGPAELDYIEVSFVDPKNTKGVYKVKGEGATVTVEGGGRP